ncbi:MAG TPA: O-antigen ligase family protein [Pyrinomonadaceae bacterium]|nr:O-antigen ligase family protein [Pyrinomonadaceae bacterium]
MSLLATDQRTLAVLGQRTAIAGLALYVAFAPHSVAASAIGVALAGAGWLLKIVATGSLGLRWSRFDLIVLLSLLWTVASSVLSEEPRISLIKLRSSWVVFLFYVTRAIVTKRSALGLAALLIISGCVGALYSGFDLARGRGVIVQSLAPGSPFHAVGIQPGDTIWRLNRTRVYSLPEIDEVLKSASPGTPLAVGIISTGENVERQGLVVTAAQQQQPSPSGLIGDGRSHRFRASGWTRHYVTFAEMLQMIALLALGLALAHLRNHGPNKYFRVAILAAAILTLGIVFTAMRTVVVAFAIGAAVIAWRSLRGGYKIAFTFALFFVLAFGAVVVSQTRARDALFLGDASSSLRAQVARVGLSRILIHPVFGHGMDAMKLHWNEWGFPGRDMLHLHSTPLQLAFDRGLPMLALWLWLMTAFWLCIAHAEKGARDLSDTNSYGLLLGILGALTGFLASSLVNYNYGDAEAAMMFWWLMGVAMVLATYQTSEKLPENRVA